MSNIIALYGGSFDPLHYAHLEIIRILRENPLYEQIILMPNYRNPLKPPSFFTPLQRLQMCKILADEMNNAPKNQKIPYIAVSDYEVRENQPVFSVQSVAFIKEQMARQHSNAQLVFVLGEDSFRNLAQWKDVQRLCQMVEFVLVKRESSQKDSQELPHIVPYARIIEYLDMPPRVGHFSSSFVRSLFEKGHIEEALKLIPVCLHTFIKAHFRL
ncbi:nicotinate-nicotinamide nucleotide adenylyltransferase [Helicobacter sp. MIT 21-1697]|uniref:nicotinate-nicotinamide nucleotide adenylyltransferase n=1 Tax=Helicobacter sp. MIT 21-1697 TaxID=2993733 RepID=UPI00224B7309|nr:nicotinate-nicotinamide nucleotide adenylyltransferase [Helicobacter sp. MIT 21-1697]MCX2716478.1 nicotinate-nicotinamide nucleotide adenylyltransferase [Helicobacter sp. MIT 21-1697]